MSLYDSPEISLPSEAVLNLSQGTVSETLSKPRPWYALSVKGREPYIRMYSWFCDTDNVQKLLASKQERDILRRSIRPTTKSQNHDTESNNNPTLKRRYISTEDQRRRLKQIFESEPYLSQAKLEQLVDELSLPMNKISNWFHIARMGTKPNTYTKDTNKISSTPLTDNNDDDDDDNDEDNTLPTIVPLNNSWFNTTNDSDSSTSPISLATSSTNIISLIDEQKPTLSISTFSSSKRFHELDKRCRDFENANNELKQLNIQLKKDLLSVSGVTELFRRGPEGQTSNSNSNETIIIEDVLNQSSTSPASFKNSFSHVSSRDTTSDEALTAIVISQRERFRIRNVELEHTTRGTDDPIDRYSRGYDASLDPFTNFTKQEKQKKYESLKIHEKFALNFGKFILSSHQSRTFFVIYFILVHILIFLSLYKMVHVGSSVRDMSQVCFDKFREHMAGVHGEKNFHFEHGHAHAHAPPGVVLAAAPPPHR
ncbi:unnamed protein product [Adineta steineri]|uniref:One cut domain family member n=1 Tax=Adineta steineri TaxID=433720 RepID=A0A815ACU9_9BILA|nr:unnamed protein product [Adineta steineri]CAF1350665.1 unnamed protein product [Adineta steineri]